DLAMEPANPGQPLAQPFDQQMGHFDTLGLPAGTGLPARPQAGFGSVQYAPQRMLGKTQHKVARVAQSVEARP
ncbi:MAG TPA: hypothetical protein VEM36_06260, partial [Xanthobacteraceae bacterium]|nr:hypothetical protein [Xanthobacteraceae bacterium]